VNNACNDSIDPVDNNRNIDSNADINNNNNETDTTTNSNNNQTTVHTQQTTHYQH